MKSVRNFTDDYYYDQKSVLDWNNILEKEGYYRVGITRSDSQTWVEIHAWCKNNIDPKDYVWVGFNFYFTQPNDAVLFALKWA